MGFDIRFPLGFFFGIVGLLLAGYGALGSPESMLPGATVNIDIVWGAVLLAFGALMLGLASRHRRHV